MLTLHSLSLEHVAGVDSAQLQLSESGVTVVYGANEGGKTTLLKAFEVLLSDVKVASSAKSVQWMYPKHLDESPTISAEMTVGDYRLHITKTYKARGGQAVLKVSAPAVENETGRRAEERLQEILAEGMDTTLRDALTIRQGESLETFVAADVESLARALDDAEEVESGAMKTSSATSDLLNRVHKEYRRYFTDGGSVAGKGELGQAKQAKDAAEDTAREARLAYEQAQAHIVAIDQFTESIELEKLKQPAAREELEVSQKELAEAEAVENKLQQLEAKAKAAGSQLEVAESRLDARQKLRTALDESGAKMAQLRESAEVSVKALDAEHAEIQEKEALRERKSGELDESEALIEVTRSIAEAHAAAAESVAAKKLADEVQQLVEQRKELREKLAGNPATPQTMNSFREALTGLRTAERFRDAIATSVHIAGPQGAEIQDSAGESFALDESGALIRVTYERSLTMGEYTVTVTPSEDLSRSERDVERARASVQKLTSELGLDEPELSDAEELATKRSQLEDELQQTSTALAAKTGDKGEAAITSRVQETRGELRNSVSELRELAGSAESIDSEKTSSVMGAAREILAVTEDSEDEESWARQIAALEVDVHTTGEELLAWNAEVKAFLRQAPAREGGMTATQKKHFTLQAELEQVEIAHKLNSERLEQARAEKPDQALEEEVTLARNANEQANDEWSRGREEFGQHSIELAREKNAGAQERVRKIESRIQQFQLDRAQREGQLEKGYGAAAELQEAESELERCTLALERVQAQADAAKLLRDTIENARAELRAKYEKPFKEAFEGLASAVFGADTSFTFGPDLRIEKRVRAGLDLDADALSGGAQEQMMMLARLAVATLVGKGGSVPIFIDDALGFSDPHRMKSMNAVLGRLGREHQVIVLTCDVDRFDSIVGAAQHSIESIRAQG